VTLNDLERRSSPFSRYFTELDSFAGHYVAVVQNRPIMSAKYHLPVILVKSDTHTAVAQSLCDS